MYKKYLQDENKFCVQNVKFEVSTGYALEITTSLKYVSKDSKEKTLHFIKVVIKLFTHSSYCLGG